MKSSLLPYYIRTPTNESRIKRKSKTYFLWLEGIKYFIIEEIMDTKELLATLRELSPEAKSKYHTVIKGLFGSYAKGTSSSKSDVDILVEFEPGADLFDLAGLDIFLENHLHLKIDLVPQNSIRKE